MATTDRLRSVGAILRNYFRKPRSEVTVFRRSEDACAPRKRHPANISESFYENRYKHEQAVYRKFSPLCRCRSGRVGFFSTVWFLAWRSLRARLRSRSFRRISLGGAFLTTRRSSQRGSLVMASKLAPTFLESNWLLGGRIPPHTHPDEQAVPCCKGSFMWASARLSTNRR